MAELRESEPLYLAGATAAGKSAVALVLAQRLGGEIISVDSMQVYRGMDIGTAKPTSEERARVPHHLLDVVDVRVPFDASQFAVLARAAIAEIQARGRRPILCGGTGLYFSALLKGLSPAPASDPALRRQLEATPVPDLLEELRAADPAGYDSIDRQNPRRVFRAVEILRLTGRPPSEFRTTLPKASAQNLFVLHRDQADLHARIHARVEQMFAAGLVEETRDLLVRGLGENRTALQALGYSQVAEHLRGEHSLAETVDLVKRRTRQFARRQNTWFRTQFDARWIQLAPGDTAESAASKIEQELH